MSGFDAMLDYYARARIIESRYNRAEYLEIIRFLGLGDNGLDGVSLFQIVPILDAVLKKAREPK